MKINKKTLYQAVEKTIFYLATLHLVIIAYYALTTQQYGYLHFGDILDLRFLFPGMEYTTGLGVVLVILVVLLFISNLYRLNNASKKK